jgi:hypothetical protein
MRHGRCLANVAAIVAGVLTILAVVAWVCCDAYYDRMLRDELARVRAQGLPTDVSQLMPASPPANQNAAPIYGTLFGTTPAQAREWARRSRLAIIDDLPQTTADLPGWAARYRLVLNGTEMRRLLDVCHRAAERPRFFVAGTWLRPGDNWMDFWWQYDLLRRRLLARALLSASEGDTRGALDWLRVAYAVADHEAEGNPRNGTVAILQVTRLAALVAPVILADADVSRGMAEGLQRQLARIDLPAAYATEHLYWIANWQALVHLDPMAAWGYAGLLETRLVVKRIVRPVVRSGLAGPWLKLETAEYVRAQASLVSWSRVPYRVLAAHLAPSPAPPGFGPIQARMAMVNLPAAAELRDRSRAQVDLLRTVLMLKVHRHEHGSYPAGLAALGPKRPQDVFSGKDFLYRRRGQGFVLYSIGENLQDDGGQTLRDLKQGDVVWACAK